MDRILIILKKENGPRASTAPALGLNTIIFKYVYWYMKQISGERLQDHWSSGLSHPGKKLRSGAIVRSSDNSSLKYQRCIFIGCCVLQKTTLIYRAMRYSGTNLGSFSWPRK